MGYVSQPSMNLVVTGFWIELEDILWWAAWPTLLSLSRATVVGIVAYVGYCVVPSNSSLHLGCLSPFVTIGYKWYHLKHNFDEDLHLWQCPFFLLKPVILSWENSRTFLLALRLMLSWQGSMLEIFILFLSLCQGREEGINGNWETHLLKDRNSLHSPTRGHLWWTYYVLGIVLGAFR